MKFENIASFSTLLPGRGKDFWHDLDKEDSLAPDARP